MLKRLFWLMIGLGFGVGMSFFVTRAVRDRIARFSPDNLAAELARALRDLGSDVRAAVSEGREAMRQREAQLRAEVESGALQ